MFGKDRVIYASNWPVSNRMGLYPVVLSVVKEYFTAKGQDAAERYFWRNSLVAYKWIKKKITWAYLCPPDHSTAAASCSSSDASGCPCTCSLNCLRSSATVFIWPSVGR